MIITLIGIGLLLIFAVVYWLERYTKYCVYDAVRCLAALSMVIGAIITLISVTFILCANTSVDRHIYARQMEREKIIKQIEVINSDYEDVSKTQVIEAVYQWNEYVYITKHNNENPWVNWFFNDRYANSLEYIDTSFLD